VEADASKNSVRKLDDIKLDEQYQELVKRLDERLKMVLRAVAKSIKNISAAPIRMQRSPARAVFAN